MTLSILPFIRIITKKMQNVNRDFKEKLKMEDTQKRNKRQSNWQKENTKKITFQFMLKGDADILEALEKSDNKAGLIKKALRFYLANNKEE